MHNVNNFNIFMKEGLSMQNIIALLEKLPLILSYDSFSARVTPTGRKVIKLSQDSGSIKYSATLYPSGKVVETRTTTLR